jgi:superfamily II DNA or RNA helicase
VAEGERLTYGHLFNPAFAAEISLIDPLPHQRIAVYQKMLEQPRLRFLLADDAGAGKTIMSGLYVREMLARRLIRRVLVVPPGGLAANWEREMRTLFALPFSIVEGTEARSGNPFVGPDSDLLIVRIDTLAGDRMFARLQEPEVLPYDLVIFDEAHKLSAYREPDYRFRKTDRYRLAEALAGLAGGDPRWTLSWACHHLLLLTATPHMGKDFPYYCLWRLLEPEILSTFDAFNAYPAEQRKRRFIRRTKEEMVRFDDTPIYPTRVSDTFSYELSQGEISEQQLYDETTDYIRTFYNRARILNRSAARLAMSIFQRRLASSTYALMQSFQRRLKKLDGLIADMRSGRLDEEQLAAMQSMLRVPDVLEEKTADEEAVGDGVEENEIAEEEALGGVVAATLAELDAERLQVQHLFELAQRVCDKGDESKFEKLRELFRDQRFRNEKAIIFTEHRDTLEFLVRRLEGQGFTGKVAQIHGGMDYQKREEQIEFFRRAADEGGATYLVATDAAGEGINLQFCWLMINYDIPWNPARLEQRMGRIHRYGQKHDPVFILNLVAGKTREGRVLATLLNKLEAIRKELRSDKVFDVVGRLFEGVSIREYMERAVLTEQDAEEASRSIEGRLTREQVRALEERERRLYGDGGDVRAELGNLRAALEHEELRRLLPGYVRRFIEKAAPLVHIAIEGDVEGTFRLHPLRSGAFDPLWPILESYSPRQRDRFTVYRPQEPAEAIFLRPGEPFFDRFRSYVCSRFQQEALRGGVFVDPTADVSYFFHLALVPVCRKAEPGLRPLAEGEVLEWRLVGLKQAQGQGVEECAIEHLLLLRGASGLPALLGSFAATANTSRDLARIYAAEVLGERLAQQKRATLRADLAAREDFLKRGYHYQEVELAAARARQGEKARAGDPRAKAELTRVRERQRSLAVHREEALSVLRREPELIAVGEVVFLAHALVVPSSDPADRKRHDAAIEAVAVRVACAHEEATGATVRDVSKAALALAAGLGENPGFDLLSRKAGQPDRCIEVKGRAGIGDIELTENEWAKACNLRDRYWLYVVFDCASPQPRLLRVQDPFGKLLFKAKGGVIIDEKEILEAAQTS